MKYEYLAIFTYEKEGISVEFPDLPGAYTCGKTDEEAMLMAQECLAGFLSEMLADGDKIPQPSRTEDIRLSEKDKIVAIQIEE
ncbi:type II toxin-antitoxin system HicB family antitoxin [Paenibacillus wulumuqiensis]|uniref:type II toxin-antitoxin system HicB family antitoxin n=1 Tax=Paenibacillus wulumuqiensis TaxID=1567107 RepID=UPI0006196B19|nr:type II toxin-antitoxin system HicB family antitoxin [Paenibacillus wulumuqiensis]